MPTSTGPSPVRARGSARAESRAANRGRRRPACRRGARAGARAEARPASAPARSRPRNAQAKTPKRVRGGAQPCASSPPTPSGNGAAICFAPRSSSARAVSPRNGCASRKRVFGPTDGYRRRPAHREEIAPGRCRARQTDAQTGPRRYPRARPRPSGSAGRWGLRRQVGTSAARQASSPWVNVVSMPLPE